MMLPGVGGGSRGHRRQRGGVGGRLGLSASRCGTCVLLAAAVVALVSLRWAWHAGRSSCEHDLFQQRELTEEVERRLLGELQTELRKESSLQAQIAVRDNLIAELRAGAGGTGAVAGREAVRRARVPIDNPFGEPPAPHVVETADTWKRQTSQQPSPTPPASALAAPYAPLSRVLEDPPPTAPAVVSASAAGRTGLLIICYNRPEYLQKTIDAVVEHFPSAGGPDVVISQDGDNPGVSRVIDRFLSGASLSGGAAKDSIRHEQTRERGDDQVGYHKLARHFGWALRHMFDNKKYDRVIILEDDLQIAPDFFDYMAATAPILDADETLLAVSAWSDIGQAKFASSPTTLLRSDFFPGLGWMINRRVWDDIGPKWPIGYWDDWLREPKNRKGRAVIRPEVSRTYTFGEKGVSQSQYFRQYLANIKLNDVAVDWASQDLSYLMKAQYDQSFFAEVAAASPLSVGELRSPQMSCSSTPKAYIVSYASVEEHDRQGYPAVANTAGWISDVKAGVPRTAYGGVVTVRINGCRVFVAGPNPSAPR